VGTLKLMAASIKMEDMIESKDMPPSEAPHRSSSSQESIKDNARVC
jgi:hypothetical protein